MRRPSQPSSRRRSAAQAASPAAVAPTVEPLTAATAASGEDYVEGALCTSLLEALERHEPRLNVSRLVPERSLEVLRRPFAKIPNALEDRLFERAARTLKRPWLGLWFAEHGADERALGFLGYLARHSRILRESFERVARFQHIYSDAEPSRVTFGPHEIVIEQGRHTGHTWSRTIGETYLALWLSLPRRWTGVHLVPGKVALRGPRPADEQPYRRFFQAPITYDAAAWQISFAMDVGDLPLHGSDLFLGELLLRQAEARLGLRGDDRDLVRRIAEAFAAGATELEEVATALGTHARTLQRQLAKVDASFRGLLDAHRQQAALRLLSDPNADLATVAARLGFSEPSGLRKAVIRWTGSPPRTSRRSRSK